MTLSIMEGHDVFKAALKDYKGGVGDIPKVLERYLGYVARTGKPLFPWDMIVALLIRKFEIICDEYGTEDIMPKIRVSVEDRSTEELKMECLKILNDLNGVPFTIQRLCELLLTPRQNYSRLDKFLRGFLRVIKVVTTVNRVGQRITTESQSFANALSPFPMNEMGDNWAGFSEESNSIIQDNSPTLDSISSTNNKADVDYEEKSTDDSLNLGPETLSYDINKQQQSIQHSVYSNDPFFIEQKTISMPPIGALFKPIDQLEAFVQNVSSQVESSSIEPKEVSKKRLSDDLILIENEALHSAKRQKLMETVTSSDVDITSSMESNDCVESLPSRSSEIMIYAEEASSTKNTNDHYIVPNDDAKDVVSSVNADIESENVESKEAEDLGDVIVGFGLAADSECIINKESDFVESDMVCNSTESMVEDNYEETIPESLDIVHCSVSVMELNVINNLDGNLSNVDSGISESLEEVDVDSGQNEKVDEGFADIGNSNENTKTINEFRDIPELRSDRVCVNDNDYLEVTNSEFDVCYGDGNNGIVDEEEGAEVCGVVSNSEEGGNVVHSTEDDIRPDQSNVDNDHEAETLEGCRD